MLRIGTVQLKSNLLLAPIAGYCDLPFRLVARSISGHDGHPALGMACTDLLCPQAILSQNKKTCWLAATCPQDQPLCMQLYGTDPAIMIQAAQWAAAHGATIIDINMGCPVDKVTKKNGGSMLLCNPDATVKLAGAIVKAVDVPVTAKIRLGWDQQRIITTTLPISLADVGIAAITVHGRTTEQKFRGRVSLDGISQVVQTMGRRHSNVPVIGNGDIKTPQDAKAMLDVTGCGGVMIGRGALGQPWIFRDTAYYLATGVPAPPLAPVQKLRLVRQHFEHLLHYREARTAINTIKRRISWYSPQLQPWPGLKRDVQVLDSIDAWQDFFDDHLDRL
jgi:tRNA-dihydrouridine synthase B